MGSTYSNSQDTKSYNPQDYNGSDLERVKSAVNDLANFRNCNRVSKVFIVNKTAWDLTYLTSGSDSGYAFNPVVHAFDSGVIQQGKYGGFLHTKRSDSACGSVGYFSVRIQPFNRSYTVCCGFGTVYSGKNRSGVQIRASDGALDTFGRLTGHGVDATGCVTDIDKLTKMNFVNDFQSTTSYIEFSAFFCVNVSFDNACYGSYTFTFEETKEARDLRAEQAAQANAQANAQPNPQPNNQVRLMRDRYTNEINANRRTGTLNRRRQEGMTSQSVSS